jgi:hypothetical protein
MKKEKFKIELSEKVSVTFGSGEDAFTGISQIEIDGVPLMDPSFQSAFVLTGPDGCRFDSFRVVRVSREDGRVVLEAVTTGVFSDRLWIRDQYNDDIRRLGRPQKPPEAHVNFIVEAVEEIFRGIRFKGIHVSVGFVSESASLARLEWSQHWEVGGSCAGATVLQQSQICRPVSELSLDSSWTDSCVKSLGDGTGLENISMQLNARCAYHQLFEFIRRGRGVFLGYYPKALCVQTSSRKNPGEDNYFVLDCLDFPLTDRIELPGKTILFSAEAVSNGEDSMKNLWFSVNRKLDDSYRTQTGIRKSRLLPTELDGMWETLAVDGTLRFGNAGKNIPASEYLETLARDVVPGLREKGFRRFWSRPYCVSDTSELLFWNKAMRGRGVMDGDVAIGSCCCVWEYKPATLFGGSDAASRFYEISKSHGMDVGIWVGNHLSTKAPILREHPDWILKDRNFDNPSGGYDSHIMAVVDWNSGVREWILNDLIQWKSRHGLDFIFFDSLGNLGLKARNYSDPLLRNNFNGLCTFLAELSAHGIEIICEGRSFMGAPYFAISSAGNMLSDVDPLVGQNNLGWFRGHEDMLSGIHIFTENLKSIPADELVDMNFRIIANNAILKFQHCALPEIFNFYKIFNLVSQFMDEREILSDDRGVLWRSDAGHRLLFSYAAGAFLLQAETKIRRVMPDGVSEPVQASKAFQTEKYGVYILG